MKAISGGLLALGLVAAAPQSHAQGVILSEPQVDLLSEMWALAGVCNQYREYDVRQDDLAAFLNDVMTGLDEGEFARVSADREARLARIRTATERLTAMPRGGDRVRAVEANAERLMSRCQVLAANSLASEYYIARR